MGHRIAVLNQGMLQQVGTPLEVYEQPGQRFVAQLHRHAADELPAAIGQQRRTAHRAGRLDAARAAATRARGRHAPRPSHCRRSPPRAPGRGEHGTAGLGARARPRWRWSSRLATKSIVHGRIAAGPVVAKLEPHRLPRAGAAIELAADTSAMHLFDASTGSASSPRSGKERCCMTSRRCRAAHWCGRDPMAAALPRAAAPEGDRRLARISRRGEGRVREGGGGLQRGEGHRGRQGDHARRPLGRLRGQDHRHGAARQGADVFIFAQDRLGGWIEAGNTIEPIDFYLDDATRERFLPATWTR